MSSLPPARTLAFGSFEADLLAGQLRRHGKRLRLPEQSFQILAMLLDQPGELVTREALRCRLWPSDTFVDFDHGLNNAVNRLREVLGDSAESPRFIETLPRRGYRFIAATNGRAPVPQASEAVTSPATPYAGRDERDLSGPRKSHWLWAAPLLLVLAAAPFFARTFFEVRWPPSSRSFVLPPEGTTFHLSRDSGGPPALSPDGTQIAFAVSNARGVSQIWIRPLASLTAQALEGTEGGAFPFWSPDGRWIAFFSDADAKLKKISIAGGSPIAICDSRAGRGGSWNRQDVILFSPTPFDGLYQVSASGSAPKPVTFLDRSVHTSHRWPKFLPDNRQFLFLAVNHGHDSTHDGIYLGSLDKKYTKRIVAAHSDASYAAGYLFYLRDDALVAQAFDPSMGAIGDGPRPTVEKVVYDPSIWKTVFDVSASGVMAYQLGGWMMGSQLSWIDRSGNTLGFVGESGFHSAPTLSPDGRKLLAGRVTRFGHYSDLWVYDLTRGLGTRLTFNDQDISSGIWSRDSHKVLFRAKGLAHDAIYDLNLDGSGQIRKVLETHADAEPIDLSPDGRFLLFRSPSDSDPRQTRLWIASTQAGGSPYPLMEQGVQGIGRFSPDGSWVAYTSKDSGREEVYVTQFHGPLASGSGKQTRPAARWQVSPRGGKCPRWRSDGRELFYVAADNMLMVVSTSARQVQFHASAARPLFRAFPSNIVSATSEFLFDVTPDGKRFIFDFGPTPEAHAPITLVENWPFDFRK